MGIAKALLSRLRSLGLEFPTARLAKSHPWQPRERVAFDIRGVMVFDLKDELKKLNEAGWADIVEVTAWMTSLMYGDIISLRFVLKDGSSFSLDEETEGWEPLFKQLLEYLPGCRPFAEWYGQMWPPYKENGIVIFANAA